MGVLSSICYQVLKQTKKHSYFVDPKIFLDRVHSKSRSDDPFHSETLQKEIGSITSLTNYVFSKVCRLQVVPLSWLSPLSKRLKKITIEKQPLVFRSHFSLLDRLSQR